MSHPGLKYFLGLGLPAARCEEEESKSCGGRVGVQVNFNYCAAYTNYNLHPPTPRYINGGICTWSMD